MVVPGRRSSTRVFCRVIESFMWTRYPGRKRVKRSSFVYVAPEWVSRTNRPSAPELRSRAAVLTVDPGAYCLGPQSSTMSPALCQWTKKMAALSCGLSVRLLLFRESSGCLSVGDRPLTEVLRIGLVREPFRILLRRVPHLARRRLGRSSGCFR